jgi:DNA-binding response OmpR family regulator
METAARVLVVEDEASLAQLAAKYLERDRHQTRIVADGLQAVAQAREFDPDVVVLDLGLPGLDGLEVCRRLRQFSDCYIIMVTARDDEVDKLVGLSVGADDYLTKPFSPRELAARVNVLLRRPRRGPATAAESPETAPATVHVGALSIDAGGREAHLAGAPVPLTPTEFDLLLALATNPKLVLSRRQLIDAVWGTAWVGDERMVDVHIRNLRRKLGDDPASPRFIRTVRGAGYRIGTGS